MFADRLKELRKAKKLTQRKLAEAAGVQYAVIRDYEQGKYKPSWENVVKIAKALGVPLTAFLDEE